MNKIITILPVIAIVNFILKNNKFLIRLLSLEIVALSLVLYILYFYLKAKIQLYFFMVIILTFRACEARIGLSLIVIISRSLGSDKLNKLSISKC